MNKHFPYILVLGVSGMVGKVIFKYLHDKHPSKVFGTTRTSLNIPNIFFLDVKKNKTELEILKNNNYEYFVNCIGLLKRNSNKGDMGFVNSNFPIILDRYCEENGIKLIHISTDAVFSNESGIVYEDSKLNPSDYYGESKLIGEITTGINIRTSTLGFDPINNKGLLEFALKNRHKEIIGFTNQTWSGSTTLQLAQFIDWIISANNFSDTRKKTNTIHFAPLGPTTKYEVLKTFSSLFNFNNVKKGNGQKVTRYLSTKYIDEIQLSNYTGTLRKALREIIVFYNDYVEKITNC